MKQTADKQKAVQSAAPVRDQEAGAGAQGIALSPPVYGVSAVDSKPAQRVANGQAENRTGLPDRLKAGMKVLSGM